MSKLKETLKDLEEALLAWDRADHDAPAEQTPEKPELQKRAKELLEQLKSQLLELSDQ